MLVFHQGKKRKGKFENKVRKLRRRFREIIPALYTRKIPRDTTILDGLIIILKGNLTVYFR